MLAAQVVTSLAAEIWNLCVGVERVTEECVLNRVHGVLHWGRWQIMVSERCLQITKMPSMQLYVSLSSSTYTFYSLPATRPGSCRHNETPVGEAIVGLARQRDNVTH